MAKNSIQKKLVSNQNDMPGFNEDNVQIEDKLKDKDNDLLQAIYNKIESRHADTLDLKKKVLMTQPIPVDMELEAKQEELASNKYSDEDEDEEEHDFPEKLHSIPDDEEEQEQDRDGMVTQVQLSDLSQINAL